jgi:hypothetical protein
MFPLVRHRLYITVAEGRSSWLRSGAPTPDERRPGNHAAAQTTGRVRISSGTLRARNWPSLSSPQRCRPRPRSCRVAILPLAGLALGLRLPSNQDFAAGRNIARDEAFWAGGEELVKAGLKDHAQALLEVRP